MIHYLYEVLVKHGWDVMLSFSMTAETFHQLAKTATVSVRFCSQDFKERVLIFTAKNNTKCVLSTGFSLFTDISCCHHVSIAKKPAATLDTYRCRVHCIHTCSLRVESF